MGCDRMVVVGGERGIGKSQVRNKNHPTSHPHPIHISPTSHPHLVHILYSGGHQSISVSEREGKGFIPHLTSSSISPSIFGDCEQVKKIINISRWKNLSNFMTQVTSSHHIPSSHHIILTSLMVDWLWIGLGGVDM